MGSATLIIGIAMLFTSMFMPNPQVSEFKLGQDTLCWAASRRLAWTDFKATQSADSITGPKASLSLSYRIYRDDPFKARPEVEVLATIDRSKSYSPRKHSDIELAREQTHFDIMELHARRMRKLISESKLPTIGSGKKVERLLQMEYKKAEDMCARYDSETADGTNPLARVKWETTLRRELTELGAYTRN